MGGHENRSRFFKRQKLLKLLIPAADNGRESHQCEASIVGENNPACSHCDKPASSTSMHGVETESERSAPNIMRGTAMEHYAGIDVSGRKQLVHCGRDRNDRARASEPEVLIRYFDDCLSAAHSEGQPPKPG